MSKPYTQFVVITMIAFFLFASSCKKINKGVIEIHKYTLSGWEEKIEGSDTYSCYIVTEKAPSLKDGELISKTTSDGIFSYVTECVYWESESAKSLGYTEKFKDEYTKEIFGQKVNKSRFQTKSGAPGPFGYWGSDESNNTTNSGTGTVVFYLETNSTSQAFNILVDGVSQKDGLGETKNLYFEVSQPDCTTEEVGPNPGLPSWNVYNIIKVNVTAGTHSWQAPSSSSPENYTGNFSIQGGECKIIKVK